VEGIAQWLLENGEKIGIVSFLVAALSLFILGEIVPGKHYRQCIQDKKDLQKQVDDGNREVLARLRVYEEVRRTQRGRKDSQ
jgi:hypothetical protein